MSVNFRLICPWLLWSWLSVLFSFVFRCFLRFVKTLPSSSSSEKRSKCGVKTFWCFIFSSVIKNIDLEKHFSYTIVLGNHLVFAFGFCLWELHIMVRQLTTLVLNYWIIFHLKLGKSTCYPSLETSWKNTLFSRTSLLVQIWK